VSTISLLTDFGLKDPYVGIMKGVILGINPRSVLVDVTHEIEAQDVREGAFLVSEYYRFFPPGTVHLCVVDPTVGSSRKPLVVLREGYVFVGPDNGLFSFLLDGAAAFEISNRAFMLEPVSKTFHGRDVFAPVAANLSLGVPPEQFGPAIDRPVLLPGLVPVIENDAMSGEIIRFDRFGNAISNIPYGEFLNFVKGGSFGIGVRELFFEKVSTGYYEEETTCLFGSSGFLEFAVFKGNLRHDRGIEKGDRVMIKRRGGEYD
jgi:S-adenosylmethionine hydrolase